MPLWLVIAVWVLWVVHTLFVAACINTWSQPRWRPSTAGSVLFTLWFPFTIFWVCWNIWG